MRRKRKKKRGKGKDYSVTLVLNDLPIEKALERDISRFEATGRIVEPKILLSCGYNPTATKRKRCM